MEIRVLLEKKNFKRNSNNLYGNFAIVEESSNEIVLMCDSIRSIPLFYQITNDVIYVSDYAEKIQKETKTKLSKVNVNELLRTGYVTENEIIFENIYQVLPGQQVNISKKDGSVVKENYFELLYTCDSNQSQEQLIDELDETLTIVFKDVIRRLNGRTALIPLSGGCDSRIVATMLKRLGYANVLCFSYGANENFEAKRSKEIAKKLGYKWLFVEYNANKWKNYYESDEYENFLKYSTRGSGIGCVQAIIAIAELKKNGMVPNDAVVIPGHALDFIAGSHLPLLNTEQNYEKKYFVDEIIERHYVLNKRLKVNTQKWSKNIKDTMTYLGILQNIVAWQWKNRQSKFIANDVRAYEYEGFDWDLPLWDMRLCKFWMKVSYTYLYNRKLQYLYMEQIINPILGIKEKYNYDAAEVEKSKAINIKSVLKKAFPWSIGIKGAIKQYRTTSNAFYNHYSKIKYFKLIMKYGLQFNINSIVADKYISIVKEHLKNNL